MLSCRPSAAVYHILAITCCWKSVANIADCSYLGCTFPGEYSLGHSRSTVQLYCTIKKDKNQTQQQGLACMSHECTSYIIIPELVSKTFEWRNLLCLWHNQHTQAARAITAQMLARKDGHCETSCCTAFGPRSYGAQIRTALPTLPVSTVQRQYLNLSKTAALYQC